MPLHARYVTLLAVALATLSVARVTHAQARTPAPKPACNLVGLPLVQGTEWVFEAVPPPAQPGMAVAAKPKQPATVKIKVASITTEGQGKNQVTTITLEEAVDERTYTTEARCTKDALFVHPQSFLFSGEPGGGFNIALGEVQRSPESRASYEFFLGKLRVPEWIEEVETTFTRQPTQGTKARMGDGKLELQRVIMIGLPEPVTTKLGEYSATPVQIDLRGSVKIELKDEAKEFNVPANTISKLWFAENVGLVQVYNTNGHQYQLVAVNPGQPAPAATR